MNEITSPRNVTSAIPGIPTLTKPAASQDTEDTYPVESVPKADTFEKLKDAEKPVEELPDLSSLLFSGDSLYASRDLCMAFDDYFRGRMDKSALMKAVDSTVSRMMAQCCSAGYKADEISSRIIKKVYSDSRLYTIRSAYGASWEEGGRVGRELGIKSSSWAYYNADYYYMSEELIDDVHSHMEALSLRYSNEPLELERDYPEGDPRNEFYASYNAYFCTEARQTCGSMIDEKMVPPRGFRMIFDSNGRGLNQYPESMGAADSMESTFDGAVYIQCEDWSFAHRVPIRMDPTRFSVSVNLMDVVKSSGKGFPAKLEAFLSNFDFFATNVGKLYTDAHKRTY